MAGFPKDNSMGLDLVTAGRDVPDDINVVIEIPKDAEPVKYEVDKASGAIFVDRVLSTPMRYPCNYGYIPNTLSGDGDPVDALVLLPLPLIAGSVIRCRPIGMLNMDDEAGHDTKLIVVPGDKVFKGYAHIRGIDDAPQHWRDRIAHFFEHYKDLESGKWVKIVGWGGADAAREEILTSAERYQQAPEKPKF
jgi:inorganic pyrophosphatase